MSKLYVDQVDPKTATTLTLGTSGDTISVPTGAGLTVTDEVKTNKISPATGTAFTLGDSGDTFTIPAGATIANSGTATGFGENNTPAFSTYLSSNQTLSHDTLTKIQYNTENFDTDSAYDNSSNYRFTVPSGEGGKYFLYAGIRWEAGNANLSTILYKNGSAISWSSFRGSSDELGTLWNHGFYNLSASDYIEVYGRFQSSGTLYAHGVSDGSTVFGGFKITT